MVGIFLFFPKKLVMILPVMMMSVKMMRMRYEEDEKDEEDEVRMMMRMLRVMRECNPLIELPNAIPWKFFPLPPT